MDFFAQNLPVTLHGPTKLSPDGHFLRTDGKPVVKSPAVPPELAEEKDWNELKRGALRGAVSTTIDLAGSQALVVSLAAGS